MSFSKRAVHTLEGNGTAIGVKDCHAYVDGQVMCLSQGSLDGPICFGKSNRHVVRLDGWGSVLRARVLYPKSRCASYLAFLLSIWMRTLTAGPDEAGF